MATISWTPTRDALQALVLTGADANYRDGLLDQLNRTGGGYDASLTAQADYAAEVAAQNADRLAAQAAVDRTTRFAGYATGTDPVVVLSDAGVPTVVRDVLSVEYAYVQTLAKKPRPQPPAPFDTSYLSTLLDNAQEFIALMAAT